MGGGAWVFEKRGDGEVDRLDSMRGGELGLHGEACSSGEGQVSW